LINQFSSQDYVQAVAKNAVNEGFITSFNSNAINAFQLGE